VSAATIGEGPFRVCDLRKIASWSKPKEPNRLTIHWVPFGADQQPNEGDYVLLESSKEPGVEYLYKVESTRRPGGAESIEFAECVHQPFSTASDEVNNAVNSLESE